MQTVAVSSSPTAASSATNTRATAGAAGGFAAVLASQRGPAAPIAQGIDAPGASGNAQPAISTQTGAAGTVAAAATADLTAVAATLTPQATAVVPGNGKLPHAGKNLPVADSDAAAGAQPATDDAPIAPPGADASVAATAIPPMLLPAGLMAMPDPPAPTQADPKTGSTATALPVAVPAPPVVPPASEPAPPLATPQIALVASNAAAPAAASRLRVVSPAPHAASVKAGSAATGAPAPATAATLPITLLATDATDAAPASPASSVATVATTPHDFGALVDRLVDARATSDAGATPQAITAALAHSDFGQVALRFEQDRHGLTVSVSSADPDFARAATTALQAPSASTDGSGAGENTAQNAFARQNFTANTDAGGNPRGQTPAMPQPDRILAATTATPGTDTPAARGIFA